METILFLAHTEADGSLPKVALESLTAAQALAAALPGSAFIAALVGADVQAAANSIAGCGASRLLGVSGPEFAQSRYVTDAAAAEALARNAGATLVIAPATSRWNRTLAGSVWKAS